MATLSHCCLGTWEHSCRGTLLQICNFNQFVPNYEQMQIFAMCKFAQLKGGGGAMSFTASCLALNIPHSTLCCHKHRATMSGPTPEPTFLSLLCSHKKHLQGFNCTLHVMAGLTCIVDWVLSCTPGAAPVSAQVCTPAWAPGCTPARAPAHTPAQAPADTPAGARS